MSSVVWLRPPGGVWEALGSGTFRGVTHEKLRARAAARGSDTCSFQVRRDPKVPHPDLSVFAECEIHVAGVPVWKGQVKETPSQEGAETVISVTGRGRWEQGSDDKFTRCYVHDRLTDYVDARTRLETDLGDYTTGWNVSSDGAISLGYPGPAPSAGGYTRAAVVLDLIQPGAAAMVAIDWSISAPWTGVANAYLAIDDDLSAALAGIGDFSVCNLAGVGTSGTFVTGTPSSGRYVVIFVEANTVQNPETWFRISGSRVYGDTAWMSLLSGGPSALTPAIVAADAATEMVGLSSDTSEIEPSGFVLPSFVLDGYKTPTEVIESVAAFEERDPRIDLEDRLVFKDRPTVARYEIGPWPGATFHDASLGSADEVFNRVLVTGNGPAGDQITVERHAGEQPEVQLKAISSPAPTNPSFATNTTGWSGTVAITRDTGVYNTSPASLAWASGTITGTFTGTFQRGLTYVLRWWQASSPAASANAVFGDHAGRDIATQAYAVDATPAGAFVSLAWTPKRDTNAATIRIATIQTGVSHHVDTFELFQAIPTAADRAGILRTQELPIRNTLTVPMGARIGDLWLRAHATTPLKGDVTVTGAGGVRKVLGGEPVHPAWLLRETGELLRLSDRIDPDTGAFGRDGRIAAVDYDDETCTAQVSIDNDSRSIDALLEQLAVVVGT